MKYTAHTRAGLTAYRLPWWLEWIPATGWAVRGLLAIIWGR